MSTTDSNPPRSSESAQRKRGVGFPVVPLPEAAATLSEAGQYGADFTESAFASYLGLSSTNSGQFRQKLAAFRDWKLISTSGDRIALSDLGKRIALSSDPMTEREALQEGFFGCRLFAEVYEDQAKGRPIDLQVLGKNAVIRWGVSPTSRQQFTKSFVESAQAAGLARAEGDQVILLPRSPQATVTPIPTSGDAPADDLLAAPPTRTSTPSSAPVVLRQVWPIATGELILEVRSRAPLPASAFSSIAQVATAIEQLAGTLAPTTPMESPA